MNSARVKPIGPVLAVSVLVGVGGCSTGTVESSTDEAARQAEISPADREAVPVTVAPARRGDLVHYVTVDGEVRATRLLDLQSEAGGAVLELPSPAGARVAAGDVLIRFDCRDAELGLRRARADRQRALLQYAARELGRIDGQISGGIWRGNSLSATDLAAVEQQFARGLISRRDLDAARRAHDLGVLGNPEQRDQSIRADVGLSAAEVAVEEAELHIARCEVRAPFAGILADVNVQVGQVVAAGDITMTLVDVDEVEIRAEVLETDLVGLRPGARATVQPVADLDRRLAARILRIVPLVDAARRVGTIVLSVEQGRPRLLSGSHVRVTMEGVRLPDRLIVPSAAVLYSDDRPLVMVVRDGVAAWEYVQLGETNGIETEILPDSAALHGVEDGEPVVIDGNFTLAHGTPVAVMAPR